MAANISNMNTSAYNCFTCTAKQSPCIIHSKTSQSTSPSLRSTASTLELERKLSTSQPTPANGSNTLRCANCFSTTTPLWRRDPQGRTICNACGLYYKLNKVHRPACLKQDVIRRRRRTSKHMKSLTIIPVNLANGVPHPHPHHLPSQMYANHGSNSNMHYGHYQRHHQGQAPYPANYYQNLGANGRLSQHYTSTNQFVQRSSTNLYNNTRNETTQQQYNQYYSHPNRSRCNSLPSAAMTNLPVLRSSGTSSTLSSPPQLSNSDSSTFTSPPLENYSTFLNSGHSVNSIVNGTSELSIGGGARGVKLPSISELLPEFVDSRAKNL